MSRASIRVLLLLLLGVLSTRAQAQRRQTSDERRAYDLFKESEASYRAGRLDEAAEKLRQAYVIHPTPILLYNLARALEGLGDKPGAIQSYRQYLRDETGVTDRGSIERRIVTPERELTAREDLTHPQAEERRART